MLFIYLLAFAFSLSLGVVIMPKILLISHKKRLYDLPDKRKVHLVPTPRLGGICFFPSILASFCFALGMLRISFPSLNFNSEVQFIFLFVGLTLLFLIGVCDDLIGLSYKKKFPAQILAACLFPLSGLWINSLGGLFGINEIPAYIGMPLTIFVVVYITNAINLIDGIDGLASGLSCISLTIIGIIHIYYGQWAYALISLVSVGVLFPFLYINIRGASKRRRKLFMGDTGSLTLGYTLSFQVLSLCNNTPTFHPLEHGLHIVAFSTLIIPLFDVVRVVCSRMRDKRPLFLPDKNHIHHKLLRTGLSPMGTMVSLLCISLFFIATNFLLVNYMPVSLLLFVDVILWFCMHYILNYFIRLRERELGIVWSRTYQKLN